MKNILKRFSLLLTALLLALCLTACEIVIGNKDSEAPTAPESISERISESISERDSVNASVADSESESEKESESESESESEKESESESESESEKESESESESESEKESEPEEFSVNAYVQPEDYEVYAITKGAVAFWESDYSTAVNVAASKYYNTRMDVDQPISISYFTDELPQGVTVTSATIAIKCEEYVDERSVTLTGNNTEASFRYLYTGANYACSVNVLLSNGETAFGEDAFYVKPTSRILEVGGIRNVRDIGGWVVEDGTKIIKEGLIYRGCLLTGSANGASMQINASGVKVFTEVMKIKTVLDLRNDMTLSSVKPSSLNGHNITFHICSNAAPYYSVADTAYAGIKEIFTLLADEENYPIYYNCSWGVDRTGTLAYILGAFLGMSKDQLMRDWEISGLYVSSVNRNDSIRQGYRNFVSAFAALPGATYREKAEGLLTAAGVTEDEMNAIRNLLLMDFEEN